ncbi:hypothetical protein ECFRIK523_5825, partial [Escherichia coli FRIK523]
RSPAQISRSHPPTPASRVRQAAASLAPCASPPYRPAFMEARHRPVSRNM